MYNCRSEARTVRNEVVLTIFSEKQSSSEPEKAASLVKRLLCMHKGQGSVPGTISITCLMEHACNTSTEDVGRGRSRVQSHPWLPRKISTWDNQAPVPMKMAKPTSFNLVTTDHRELSWAPSNGCFLGLEQHEGPSRLPACPPLPHSVTYRSPRLFPPCLVALPFFQVFTRV